MQNASRYLAVIAALAAPVAGHGKVRFEFGALPGSGIVQAGYEDLAETEQRRLDFYAEKIVVEMKATVEANQAGDAAAFNKHGAAMKQTAERFLTAAEKAGLTETEADFIFHQHLIAEYQGPLPDFMVTSTGPAGIRALVSLMVAPTETEQADYVDSIRNAGDDAFN